jgi:two-component system LytT family response regulator
VSGLLRALIVDDEPLARDRIRALLANETAVEICGECTNGRDAVSEIERLAPDLVFLDIRMPDLDGMGVIDAVGAERMPVVIFVTAHDEHALEAFERRAVDYILKPIDPRRFQVTVRRVVDMIRAQRAGELNVRLFEVLGDLRARSFRPERIAVKSGGSVIFVRVDEIRWISAAGNYVEIHTVSETHLLRGTTQEFEAELDPAKFLRIHRSTIVNIDRIREIEQGFKGDSVVILDDGTKLSMSRSHREKLNERLGRLS